MVTIAAPTAAVSNAKNQRQAAAHSQETDPHTASILQNEHDQCDE